MKYKLLKNLPFVKAGTIGVENTDHSVSFGGWMFQRNELYMLEDREWFEKIPDGVTYKLIKKYPYSPEISIVVMKHNNGYYKDIEGGGYRASEIENYPEFWEKQ